jgi:hypothetical protein
MKPVSAVTAPAIIVLPEASMEKFGVFIVMSSFALSNRK